MNKKGITLIEMVIVVIILIILAITALWSTKQITSKAEADMLLAELKAVYTGVLKIRQEYNLENFENYTQGEHYNDVLTDASDNVVDDWYVIYGMDDVRYDKKIIRNLGVDELKRNYKVNFEEADVEFLDGPVTIDKYEINSYEDMKTLQESGVI